MMLKDKVSLITGCNGGIGISLVKKFSENGSDIICCVRKKTKEFEKEINEISKKNNNSIIPIYFDLNNENEILEAIDHYFEKYKKVCREQYEPRMK